MKKILSKKVYCKATGIRSVSINPTIPDCFIPYGEEPRIVGKVIEKFMPLG